jgi:hypothetical protein
MGKREAIVIPSETRYTYRLTQSVTLAYSGAPGGLRR